MQVSFSNLSEKEIISVLSTNQIEHESTQQKIKNSYLIWLWKKEEINPNGTIITSYYAEPNFNNFDNSNLLTVSKVIGVVEKNQVWLFDRSTGKKVELLEVNGLNSQTLSQIVSSSKTIIANMAAAELEKQRLASEEATRLEKVHYEAISQFYKHKSRR